MTASTRTVLAFLLIGLLAIPSLADEKDSKGKAKASAPHEREEQAARDALVRFNKEWKGYTNEPNHGDPRWKLKMETLVRLARAGPAAVALLEEAAKKDSKWSSATRELAEGNLGLLRKRELQRALADYDLTQMDSARVGKLAPDSLSRTPPAKRIL